MSSLAVWIGFALASQGISINFLAFLAMLSAFLICGAGQAVNDYFDRGIDAKLHPERTIPSKQLTATTVFWYSILLFLAGIIISFFINAYALLIASITSLLLFLYSSSMKKIKFLGNWVVALGTGLTFLFGASISLNGLFYAVYPFVLAVFVNVIREITKDLEDLRIEKGQKISLAELAGIPRTKFIALVYSLMVLFVAVLPFYFNAFNVFYLAFILLSVLILFYSIVFLFKDNYSRAQKFQKIAMLASFIAFIAALF
jgi:geranylgeranylglycerol-phosphate geranylgeranyltransferase